MRLPQLLRSLVLSLFLVQLALSVSAAEEQTDPASSCEELILKIKQRQVELPQGDSREFYREFETLRRIQSYIDTNLLPRIQKEEWSGAAQALQAMLSMQPPPQISEQIDKLLESVQAEQQAEQDRVVEELETFKKNLTEHLLECKTASELDAPIKELNQIAGQISKITSWDRGTRPETNSILELLVNWQDFLYLKSQGKNKEAQRHLDQIERQVSRVPLVPRSQVLQLGIGLSNEVAENNISEELDTILDTMDGPESYERIFKQLQDLFDRSNQNYTVSRYRDLVESFMLARNYINEDNPYAAFNRINWVGRSSGTEADPRMSAERERLILEALSLGQPEELQPLEDESVIVYVDRVAAALGKAEQWQEQWEFLDRARASQVIQNNPSTYEELRNSSKLIAGTRYEQIGEDETAYMFYSDVIDSPSRFNQGIGAQAGIKRLLEKDPGIAQRARIKQAEQNAYRRYFQESLSRDGGRMPAHMLSEKALSSVIDEKVKETVATQVQQMQGSRDPFAPSSGDRQKKPNTKPGQRFEVTYLDDQENQVTQIFDHFSQSGQHFLRTIDHHELTVDMVQSIEIKDPLPLKTIKQWPSKFENKKDIPITKLKITLLSGEEFEDQMYSTLFLTFTNEAEHQRLSEHPPRILSIKRVP